jgi:hypothetical protein
MYAMKPIAKGMFRIRSGRKDIGWVRLVGDTYYATAYGKEARAQTSTDAFRALVVILNNDTAKRAGFADARSMIIARNAEVARDVAALNEAAGMPVARVRKGRRILC